MDKCFLKLNIDGEEAYQTFHKVIEMANDIINTHKDSTLADVSFYPDKGTVAFSSGMHGWAFNDHVENLYDGLLHDEYAKAIKNCNSDGPLMLYVSKMIPASDK
ncbi:elongation factor 2-like protein, partial [Tanacetum coccineum]